MPVGTLCSTASTPAAAEGLAATNPMGHLVALAQAACELAHAVLEAAPAAEQPSLASATLASCDGLWVSAALRAARCTLPGW